MLKYNISKNKRIFVALTYVCTAHCKKCITRYHKFVNRTMDYQIMRETLRFLKKINFTGIIVLGSGEPLTYPYLDEFIEGVFSINDTIKLEILSNGKIFTNTVIRESWINDRITFGITLDGFYQDELLGMQTGIEIEKIKKQVTEFCITYGGENIYLNYTLNNYNKKSIKDYVFYAANNKIKAIYITPLKAFKSVDSIIKEHVLEEKELWKCMDDLQEVINENNIDNVYLPQKNSKPRWFCWKRESANPIIDIDGSITFCSGREEGIIGNITSDEIDEKWYDQLLKFDDTEYSKIWCEACISRNKEGIFIPSRDVYIHLPNEEA